MPARLRTLLSVLLIALGSLQMLGLVLGLPALRGLGVASTAAPLPLVFSHFRGVETFALDFTVHLDLADGATWSAAVTPALYARIAGPYNRRNVYGAAFAYGPALNAPGERALWQGVLRYGFCRPGPLLREFQVGGEAVQVRVIAREKTRTPPGINPRSWTLEVACRP